MDQALTDVYRQGAGLMEVIAENRELRSHLTMALYTVRRLTSECQGDVDRLEEYFDETSGRQQDRRRDWRVLGLLALFCCLILFMGRIVSLANAAFRYAYL